jgi:hypothetical protein
MLPQTLADTMYTSPLLLLLRHRFVVGGPAVHAGMSIVG